MLLKHTPAHQSHPRFLSSHNTTLLSMGEYVVLVGDVGSGKSTVGEKLTGVEGRSSDSSTSFTTEMAVFQVELQTNYRLRFYIHGEGPIVGEIMKSSRTFV